MTMHPQDAAHVSVQLHTLCKLYGTAHRDETTVEQYMAGTYVATE
jgi:hypothetical protein